MTVTRIHYSADDMVDYHPSGPRPPVPTSNTTHHRKALPSAAQASGSQYQQEYQQQVPQQYPLRHSSAQSHHVIPSQQSQLQQPQQRVSSSTSHSRSRTVSSSIFPQPTSTPSPPQTSNSNRRLSTATNGFPGHQPTPTMQQALYHPKNIQRSGTNNSTSSTAPRRSTSSRSSTLLAPTSYVALMRKQKATVWCDRSQTLDARTAAAQKAAKHRAALEVHNAASGRTSTIISNKVRSTKTMPYVGPNLSGVSVPVRLSTNEMFGDDEDETHDGRSIGGDTASVQARIHNRTGSGRSSVHSGKYPSGYPRSNAGGRFSTGSTPPSGSEGGAAISPGVQNNPSPNHSDTSPSLPLGAYQAPADKDYFANSLAAATTRSNTSKSGAGTPSSGEEDKFGEAAELRSPVRQSAVAHAAEQAKKAEDLKRRGSVDERMIPNLGRGRLFVANPDLDD